MSCYLNDSAHVQNPLLNEKKKQEIVSNNKRNLFYCFIYLFCSYLIFVERLKTKDEKKKKPPVKEEIPDDFDDVPTNPT